MFIRKSMKRCEELKRFNLFGDVEKYLTILPDLRIPEM